jgi:L-glutamine-phosphate cytidylyltransferase
MEGNTIKVIILAAGIGSRLSPITNNIPKCMVEINNCSIIRRLINQLSQHIPTKNITIIGGYKFKILKDHLKDLEVELIINKKFLETNNMYSLSMGLQNIVDKNLKNLIIINADCIYENEVIEKAAHCYETSVIMVDTSIFNEESMKIRASEGLVKEISKNIPKPEAYATSIDLYNINLKDLRVLKDIIHSYIEDQELNLWSEVALNDLCDKKEIGFLDIGGKRWYEIDNLQDLEKANKLFENEI